MAQQVAAASRDHHGSLASQTDIASLKERPQLPPFFVFSG
jgi:hypothetical protein